MAVLPHVPQMQVQVQMPPQQIQQQHPISLPPQQMQSSSNLPYKVNQIRLHFGFSSFSPILTDEDEGDNNGDLASDLLNSLGGDFKMPVQPQTVIQREKQPVQAQQQQQQQQQQQYQGYYGYGYQQQAQQPPPRAMPAENRWDYRAGMGQQPPQVYNPLNPMAGKYSPAPPQPQMGSQMGSQMGGQMPQMGGQMTGQMAAQMGGQMYKNPMMERQRQPQPQMGQYYRPPSGDGYDRRYQGGYQQ